MSTREYKNNKFERPFSPYHAIHIVLRTRFACLRSRRMLSWLSAFIPAKSKHFGIRLYHFAIVNIHLHLLIRAYDRETLSSFLRVITGVVARKALGAEKGKRKGLKMWEKRPYSRVLSWYREFKNVLAYIERNAQEAIGKIPYIARNQKLDPETKRRITFDLSPQLILRISEIKVS